MYVQIESHIQFICTPTDRDGRKSGGFRLSLFYIRIRFPQTQPEIFSNEIILYTFLIRIKPALDVKNWTPRNILWFVILFLCFYKLQSKIIVLLLLSWQFPFIISYSNIVYNSAAKIEWLNFENSKKVSK